MKISVITVCYNSAKTLEKTIISVTEQSYDNIEHIVIDGDSSDNTKQILDIYKGSIAHILIEPDQGIYDAMNKGLALSTGDVICFLNSDDHYSSSTVLSEVVALIKQKQLDAVFGDVGYFRNQVSKKIVRRFNSGRFEPDKFSRGYMPAHPALFLNSNVLQRVKTFKTDYKIAGDFEFMIRCFYGQNLRYKYIPKIMVNMQLGGVSTRGILSKVQLNKEMLRACRENGISTNLLKILSKYPVKLMELFQL